MLTPELAELPQSAKHCQLLHTMNLSTRWPRRFHFQLIVEYLGGKKYPELAWCSCGILLQYHTQPNIPQMFVRADYTVRLLILYTCGNGTKNSWIQRLRCVPWFFCSVVQGDVICCRTEVVLLICFACTEKSRKVQASANHFLSLSQVSVTGGGLGSIPAATGQAVGYTLDRLPVCLRANTQNHQLI